MTEPIGKGQAAYRLNLVINSLSDPAVRNGQPVSEDELTRAVIEIRDVAKRLEVDDRQVDQ